MHNNLFNTKAEYEAVKDTLWAGPQPIVVGIKETGEVIWKNTVVPPGPTVNNYITYEGPVSFEWQDNVSEEDVEETAVGVRVSYYITGAGLEYSIEDTPTTWTPITFGEDVWEVFITPHAIGATYNKLHIRARDGGNTAVGNILPYCTTVSGPVLSLLDNTLSITSLPEAAFCGGLEDGWPRSAGVFAAADMEGACDYYLKDVSGLVFPNLPVSN